MQVLHFFNFTSMQLRVKVLVKLILSQIKCVITRGMKTLFKTGYREYNKSIKSVILVANWKGFFLKKRCTLLIV